MDKKAIIETINLFYQGIKARGIQPKKIILYGSCATGTNWDGSDIDLVVISNDFRGMDYWERIDIISDVIYEIFAPIEAVALTEKEWANGESFVTDFAKNGEVFFAA